MATNFQVGIIPTLGNEPNLIGNRNHHINGIQLRARDTANGDILNDLVHVL